MCVLVSNSLQISILRTLKLRKTCINGLIILPIYYTNFAICKVFRDTFITFSWPHLFPLKIEEKERVFWTICRYCCDVAVIERKDENEDEPARVPKGSGIWSFLRFMRRSMDWKGVEVVWCIRGAIKNFCSAGLSIRR